MVSDTTLCASARHPRRPVHRQRRRASAVSRISSTAPFEGDAALFFLKTSLILWFQCSGQLALETYLLAECASARATETFGETLTKRSPVRLVDQRRDVAAYPR
jgi:hypothetical protein